MPDAFTEQAVHERAAFLEPSDLRVFFCYFHSVLLGFAQCCWNLLSTSQSTADFKNLQALEISWATELGRKA